MPCALLAWKLVPIILSKHNMYCLFEQLYRDNFHLLPAYALQHEGIFFFFFSDIIQNIVSEKLVLFL